MFHTFMPLIPLTLAGALYFRRRVPAYGFPVVLVLTRALLTQPSLIEFFTVFSLLLTVFAVRASGVNHPSVLKTARIAFLAILGYEIISNFGVWALGGCLPGQPALYAYSFSGLAKCYQAALPYLAVHFLRDIPLSLGAVKLFELVAGMRPAVQTARQNA